MKTDFPEPTEIVLAVTLCGIQPHRYYRNVYRSKYSALETSYKYISQSEFIDFETCNLEGDRTEDINHIDIPQFRISASIICWPFKDLASAYVIPQTILYFMNYPLHSVTLYLRTLQQNVTLLISVTLTVQDFQNIFSTQ